MCNSLYSALDACTFILLVVSVYTHMETTVTKCVVWDINVRSGVPCDLSPREVSGVLLFFVWLVQLGAWPGVPGCRGGLRPGCCSLLFCWVLFMRLLLNGPTWLFHLFTCKMGFAPIKRTCTA